MTTYLEIYTQELQDDGTAGVSVLDYGPTHGLNAETELGSVSVDATGVPDFAAANNLGETAGLGAFGEWEACPTGYYREVASIEEES